MVIFNQMLNRIHGIVYCKLLQSSATNVGLPAILELAALAIALFPLASTFWTTAFRANLWAEIFNFHKKLVPYDCWNPIILALIFTGRCSWGPIDHRDWLYGPGTWICFGNSKVTSGCNNILELDSYLFQTGKYWNKHHSIVYLSKLFSTMLPYLLS